MKRILVALLLAALPVAGPVGCSTPPSVRVVEVQSLKAVGEAAEAAVALSAHLYASGTVTATQARAVIDFYDGKFQPAFRLAATAARADLSQPASADLAALASQLVALVNPPKHSP